MPTMHDVARRANVSLSTVSYAINGTRPISEETRQRIFTAMRELGYQPHALARGLASKRSRILALLFPTSERGLGNTDLEFIIGAVDAARELGYHLILWTSGVDDVVELGQLIQQGLVDGVVLMEVHLHDKRVEYLREIEFPFSVIGRCADVAELPYTDIDFEQTVREAISHLVELGHADIGFFNYALEVFEAGYGPAVRVAQAFERITQEMGVRGVARFCHAYAQAGYEAFNALLDEHPEITAIAVMNERSVPGILQAIDDRGWCVPDDISLILLVSSRQVAEMSMPPLTTLAPPAAELGKLGVELLVQQLDGRSVSASQTLLPCHLVVGESTGVRRQHLHEQNPLLR
ncbi:LacI family DNA-binding transcriptional regulator [Caldilinea sp.]|uniref:LacI family DNA-binding transcriptional regulator n=1 Tax=Caldilinea sp. TaxID=2293560 RepID=UPI002613D21A|nr:LacI family DNA-binding transcriptional regulator [uncultured Caldilinea sp.]